MYRPNCLLKVVKCVLILTSSMCVCANGNIMYHIVLYVAIK